MSRMEVEAERVRWGWILSNCRLFDLDLDSAPTLLRCHSYRDPDGDRRQTCVGVLALPVAFLREWTRLREVRCGAFFFLPPPLCITLRCAGSIPLGAPS